MTSIEDAKKEIASLKIEVENLEIDQSVAWQKVVTARGEMQTRTGRWSNDDPDVKPLVIEDSRLRGVLYGQRRRLKELVRVTQEREATNIPEELHLDWVDLRYLSFCSTLHAYHTKRGIPKATLLRDLKESFNRSEEYHRDWTDDLIAQETDMAKAADAIYQKCCEYSRKQYEHDHHPLYGKKPVSK